jgi:hypothetical protein
VQRLRRAWKDRGEGEHAHVFNLRVTSGPAWQS